MLPLKDEDYMKPARSCLCFHMRKAGRIITQEYERALEPVDLKATQFSLLVGIRLLGPVTMMTLAKSMGMDRTTVTRNVRPLEQRAFIEMTSGTDRRERRVQLTPEGQRVLKKALPLWKQAQEDARDRLGDDRIERLLMDLSAAANIG